MCTLGWGILSHAAALPIRAGEGKVSFNPHLCWDLRNFFSSPTLLAELVQTRFCFQGGNSCFPSLVVPLELTFSQDPPGAQHEALVPQLLEICLEQGLEAQLCLYFFSCGKSWQGYLQRILNVLLSSHFPHGAGQQNNPKIKTLDLRNPSSPKESLECWEGWDIFGTSHLDNSLLFLTLCAGLLLKEEKNLWIFGAFLSLLICGIWEGEELPSLSCAGDQAGKCCDSFCSFY